MSQYTLLQAGECCGDAERKTTVNPPYPKANRTILVWNPNDRQGLALEVNKKRRLDPPYETKPPSQG